MKKYHKIQSIFKRDEKTHKFIENKFSLPEFEYLKNNTWTWTEKIDGTNIRVMWNGEKVIFGGKTDNAQIPVFLLYKLQELFEGTLKKQLFRNIFIDKETNEPITDVCLYGEGYGLKIQKGGGNYISDGVNFILFDVKIGEWWLEREDVEDIASKLEIDIVPIIGQGIIPEVIELIKSKKLYSNFGNKDFLAEGIVLRPKIELKTRSGQRIITKLKHKDF